jgi:type IV pilus modification protein PilV
MRAMSSRAESSVSARGMSLVECLVALLVLTIGLLGMARLMVEGLRNGRLALVRTQAVALVSDMTDRIRANPEGREAYDCAAYFGSPAEQGCAPTDSTAGTNCSAMQLAEDDLARWQSAARTMMPLVSDEPCAANVVYTRPASPREPAKYSVSVSWNEPGEATPLVHVSDLMVSP